MKKYIKNTLGVTLILISINAFSFSWQKGNVFEPDLQDCIIALKNGFVYDQRIKENFNMYSVLYDEYGYSITVSKKHPKYKINCLAYSYEKYKPSK